MEPLLKILYVPTWNWEQKDYCIIPDHAAKESLEQSQGGQAVSDTPRTESFNCYDNGCDNPLHAWGAFSAELERELNSANTIIRQQQLLDEENLRLKERIKRLDETLEGVTDKLDGAWGIYMKFKEAKP
jgi:hypothetical protein